MCICVRHSYKSLENRKTKASRKTRTRAPLSLLPIRIGTFLVLLKNHKSLDVIFETYFLNIVKRFHQPNFQG